MAQITIPPVPHQLTAEEATRRIQTLLSGLKQQYGALVSDLQEEWSDDQCTFSFQAMGLTVSGTMKATSSQVEISADLSGEAGIFQSMITSAIRGKLSEVLT